MNTATRKAALIVVGLAGFVTPWIVYWIVKGLAG